MGINQIPEKCLEPYAGTENRLLRLIHKTVSGDGIMKRVQLLILVLLINVFLFGCSSKVGGGPQPTGGETGVTEQTQQATTEETQQTRKSDEDAVTELVKAFGSKLQEVSLLAPEDILKKSMKENYGDYVTETLLAQWISNPQKAPGRLTSSPWPDRIEILSANKLAEDEYEVKGEIIEITSVEKENGGIAAKRPVILKVIKSGDRWLIGEVTLGAYEEAGAMVYENTGYGFTFSLPQSWKGYTIVEGKWEGYSLEGSQEGKITETGPVISIRHPLWTEKKPRQDIPIMVFTLDQWNLVNQEKLSVSAAPIGPSELGRNGRYVFALPARYNYAFPEGFEEVEEILKNNPLHPLQEQQ